MVSQHSYLYNVIFSTWKASFYFETGPWIFHNIGWPFPLWSIAANSPWCVSSFVVSTLSWTLGVLGWDIDSWDLSTSFQQMFKCHPDILINALIFTCVYNKYLQICVRMCDKWWLNNPASGSMYGVKKAPQTTCCIFDEALMCLSCNHDKCWQEDLVWEVSQWKRKKTRLPD